MKRETIIKRFKNGNVKEEFTFLIGKQFDAECYIARDEYLKDEIKYDSFKGYVIKHKPNGPTYTKYNENGDIILKEFFIRNLNDNKNDACLQIWDKTGFLRQEVYFENNAQYRHLLYVTDDEADWLRTRIGNQCLNGIALDHIELIDSGFDLYRKQISEIIYDSKLEE